MSKAIFYKELSPSKLHSVGLATTSMGEHLLMAAHVAMKPLRVPSKKRRSTKRKLVMQKSLTAHTVERTGKLLTHDQFEAVWMFLPSRYQTGQCSLAYSTMEHGVSIKSFLQRLKGFPASIMIVRTTTDEIFGSFCGAEWNPNHDKSRGLGFYGSGESFLFTSQPVAHIYHWVGWTSESETDRANPSKNLFQAVSLDTLIIGGGGDPGIQFQSDFTRGRSGKCWTFNNDPLCQANDFLVSTIEVYGLRP